MDYRFAAGRSDPFPVLAKELVAMQPDVVLAHTPGGTIALQRETRTIPIVFVNVSDPIGMGFIASSPRPGGNLTGCCITRRQSSARASNAQGNWARPSLAGCRWQSGSPWLVPTISVRR